MNLSPLKAFIPGKAMLVMLTFLALALGWYFFQASATGDHLVRRNFNHLNQIGSNIDASLNSLRAQVMFNRNVLKCGNSGEDVDSCVKQFKNRLVGLSPLVDRADSIRATHQYVTARDIFADEGGGEGDWDWDDYCLLPADVIDEDEKMRSYLSRGRIHTEFLLAQGVEEQRQYYSKEQRQVWEDKELDCAYEYLLTFLEIDLRFDLIQGLAVPENYFDSVIIARSSSHAGGGGKGASNVGGNNWSQILYNTGSSRPQASETDIRQIFQARAGFERFNSIYELEYHQAGHRQRSSGFAELAEKGGSGKKNNEKELVIRPFTQSTVVPIEIGDFSHLAFVQPLHVSGLGEEDLVIIGVVSQAGFNKLKYVIPFNLLALIMLALLLGVLSLNFIRLALLKKKGVLFRRDVYLSYVSLIGVAALFTVFVGNLAATAQFVTSFEEDKLAIFERIRQQFDAELGRKLEILLSTRRQQHDERLLAQKAIWTAGYCPRIREVKFGPMNPPDYDWIQLRCAGEAIPQTSSLFQMDEQGNQLGYFFTTNKYSPGGGFNLAQRDYFRRIVDGTGWRYVEPLVGAEDPAGELFYVERIESLADNSLETAISLRASSTEDDAASARPAVTALLTKIQSLEDVVLPPGYGFAVFEDTTGKVLYHSDSKRSLRENFYGATDDNAALKGAVISRAIVEMDFDYKGETVSAIVAPLWDVPWTLAVYYRSSLLDIVNFHFGITATLLSAAFIVTFLLAMAVCSWLRQRLQRPGLTDDRRVSRTQFIPPWLFPMTGPAAAASYVRLTTAYFGLLLLYVGVIYYVNILYSWPWLLAVPALMFWLWHRVTCSEYYRMESWGLLRLVHLLPPTLLVLLCVGYAIEIWLEGGHGYVLGTVLATVLFWWFYARLHINRIRVELEASARLASTVAHYRRATCLFVLFLSALPSILLYNENFDVHEKLWVEYVNWSNVDKLKARGDAYRRYSSRMYQLQVDELTLPSKISTSVPEYLMNNWDGVYLPRTAIYQLRGYVDDGCPEYSEAGIFAELQVERWPEWDLDKSLSEQHKAENTTNLLVTRQPGLMDYPCHPHVEFDNQARVGEALLPEILLQISFVKSLVKSLPILSMTGSLLESFTERDFSVHSQASDGEVLLGTGGELFAMDDRDMRLGLQYLTSSAFPHTRSVNSLKVLVPYFLMISLAAALVYWLSGFLMLRQMAIRFASRQTRLNASPREDQLDQSFALVVPAGATLSEATEALSRMVPQSADCRPVDGVQGLLASVDNQLLVIGDLLAAIKNRKLASRVLDYVDYAIAASDYSPQILILSDIDPHYWLKQRHLSEAMSEEEFHRWEALLLKLPIFMFETLPPAIEPRDYRSLWQHSSQDERMIMAGLHHEGVVNYRNRASTFSLYRRGLVKLDNLQLQLVDAGWESFVSHRVSREAFNFRASRYENKLWLSIRAPLLLALLVVAMFLAYVAQDEMKVAFSLIGTVGATMAAVGALSDRFRDFRGYLGS